MPEAHVQIFLHRSWNLSLWTHLSRVPFGVVHENFSVVVADAYANLQVNFLQSLDQAAHLGRP